MREREKKRVSIFFFIPRAHLFWDCDNTVTTVQCACVYSIIIAMITIMYECHGTIDMILFYVVQIHALTWRMWMTFRMDGRFFASSLIVLGRQEVAAGVQRFVLKSRTHRSSSKEPSDSNGDVAKQQTKLPVHNANLKTKKNRHIDIVNKWHLCVGKWIMRPSPQRERTSHTNNNKWL